MVNQRWGNHDSLGPDRILKYEGRLHDCDIRSGAMVSS